MRTRSLTQFHRVKDGRPETVGRGFIPGNTAAFRDGVLTPEGPRDLGLIRFRTRIPVCAFDVGVRPTYRSVLSFKPYGHGVEPVQEPRMNECPIDAPAGVVYFQPCREPSYPCPRNQPRHPAPKPELAKPPACLLPNASPRSEEPSTKPTPTSSAPLRTLRHGSCWWPQFSPHNVQTHASTWSRRSSSAASLLRRPWPKLLCPSSKPSSAPPASFATKPSPSRARPAKSPPSSTIEYRKHSRS